jgi:hypothetical protein
MRGIVPRFFFENNFFSEKSTETFENAMPIVVSVESKRNFGKVFSSTKLLFMRKLSRTSAEQVFDIFLLATYGI